MQRRESVLPPSDASSQKIDHNAVALPPRISTGGVPHDGPQIRTNPHAVKRTPLRDRRLVRVDASFRGIGLTLAAVPREFSPRGLF